MKNVSRVLNVFMGKFVFALKITTHLKLKSMN